jgi:hypothetical protein
VLRKTASQKDKAVKARSKKTLTQSPRYELTPFPRSYFSERQTLNPSLHRSNRCDSLSGN